MAMIFLDLVKRIQTCQSYVQGLNLLVKQVEKTKNMENWPHIELEIGSKYPNCVLICLEFEKGLFFTGNYLY